MTKLIVLPLEECKKLNSQGKGVYHQNEKGNCFWLVQEEEEFSKYPKRQYGILK